MIGNDVSGLAQPTTTAMLHNASTLGIGLMSTKNYYNYKKRSRVLQPCSV